MQFQFLPLITQIEFYREQFLFLNKLCEILLLKDLLSTLFKQSILCERCIFLLCPTFVEKKCTFFVGPCLDFRFL